jgi:hypothetical protein
MHHLSSLTDDALLHELHLIVGSHRRVTAGLILHLAEVDARRLHVDRGFSSLFSYCVEQLRFSEDEACRRIEAARLARQFPAIHALLETGSVSLTVLGLLKAHLTPDNHQELLAGVSGSSVRHAKEWLAARFPQPDVPWSIQKRPESRRTDASPVSARGAKDVSPVSTRGAKDVSPVSARGAASPARARGGTDAMFVTMEKAADASSDRSHSADPRSGSAAVRVGGLSRARSLVAPSATAGQARVEPLSQDRFLVKFTASRAMRDKLEQARDLMRHANPSGDLAIVLERAVDSLIADLEKTRFGQTSRPQKKPRPAKESRVTHAARREVVGNDGWRCSFVAADGRRCDARAFLELDHKTPQGRGGSSAASNLRVLCRAHNRWAAERAYGRAHVARAVATAKHAKLVGVRAEIGDIDAKVEDRSAKIGDIDAKVEDRGAKIGDIDAKVEDRSAKIGDIDAKVEDRGAKIGDIDAKVEDRSARIGDDGDEILIVGEPFAPRYRETPSRRWAGRWLRRFTHEAPAREPADLAPDASSALEKKERARRLHHALDQLSDKRRAVVVLRDLEGMDMIR